MTINAVEVPDNMLVMMVKDLEDTREKYKGYSYPRTMRNILIGKRDAIIAPWFRRRPYYGRIQKLSLDEMTRIMDLLVRYGQLNYIISDSNKKLYCTNDYLKSI